MADKQVYRSIDLFAGIGGIRMGFDTDILRVEVI